MSDFTGTIRAIIPSDKEAGLYAIYGNNKLYLAKVGMAEISEIATLPNIQTIAHGLGDGRLEGKSHEITLSFHHPYVCVTERFGVNAALVNIITRIVRELKREDYHCDVSSYSFEFLERDGRILYIIQTQWNRLDIFDAETGENLTHREVYCRNTGQKKENGSPIYEYKNYLDYFHSLLHVSPDGKHFLSNGWVWSPFDQIRIFETDKFFRNFELGSIGTMCGSGYNWDRPCTFIDNDLFAVVIDDALKTGNLDTDEEQGYEYKPLVFFRVSDDYKENDYGFKWLNQYSSVACEAFAPGDSGEVSGKLYYDKQAGYLVALTPNGAYAINMTGEILNHLPDVTYTNFQPNNGFVNGYNPHIGWDYSLKHHLFYTWQDDVGTVERRFD